MTPIVGDVILAPSLYAGHDPGIRRITHITTTHVFYHIEHPRYIGTRSFSVTLQELENLLARVGWWLVPGYPEGI